MKCSLVLPIFLKRSPVFPILLFSSISFIDHLRRLSYLSLLFFGTLHQMRMSFFFCFDCCFSSFRNAVSQNNYLLSCFSRSYRHISSTTRDKSRMRNESSKSKMECSTIQMTDGQKPSHKEEPILKTSI